MNKYSQILKEELIQAVESENEKSFLKYCLKNRESYNLTVKNWVSEVKDIEIANDTKTRQAIKDNIAIFTSEITKNYPINTKDSGKVIKIDKSDKKYHLLDFFLHETEDFQKICAAIKDSGARNELYFNDNKNTIDLNGKNIPLPENRITIFYDKPKNMDQQRRPFQLITGDSSEQSTQQKLIECFMRMLFGENYEETAEKIRKCYKIETKLDLAQEKEGVEEQLSRLGTNDLQSIKSRCDNTEYITSQKPFEIEFDIKDPKNTTLNDDYQKSLIDLLKSNEDIKQQEQKKLEECKIDVSFEEDLEGNANVRMVVCVKKGDKIISFFNFDASSCADGFKIYNAGFINDDNVFDINKKQEMETKFKEILDNAQGDPKLMCNKLAERDLTFVWKNLKDNKEVYCFGKADIEAKIKEQANIFTTLKNHETELLDMGKLNEKNISTRNNELQTVIETMGNNNNELLTQLNKNFEDYEKALNGTFKQAKTSFKLELTRALKHYGLKDTAELGEITQKAFFTSSIKSQQNALKVTEAGQYSLNTNNELELIVSAPSPQVNGGWFNALYRGASQLIGYN